jgi:hypothetical protein
MTLTEGFKFAFVGQLNRVQVAAASDRRKLRALSQPLGPAGPNGRAQTRPGPPGQALAPSCQPESCQVSVSTRDSDGIGSKSVYTFFKFAAAGGSHMTRSMVVQ